MDARLGQSRLSSFLRPSPEEPKAQGCDDGAAGNRTDYRACNPGLAAVAVAVAVAVTLGTGIGIGIGGSGSGSGGRRGYRRAWGEAGGRGGGACIWGCWFHQAIRLTRRLSIGGGDLAKNSFNFRLLITEDL